MCAGPQSMGLQTAMLPPSFQAVVLAGEKLGLVLATVHLLSAVRPGVGF